MTTLFSPNVLRWLLGISFIAMALWTLMPDSFDESKPVSAGRFGVFGVTFVAFFLAEMGDKTQLATVALAAHYAAPVAAVAGTTMGMLIADVPAVFAGHHFAQRLPLRLVRAVAASLFALMGLIAVFYGERPR